MLLRQISCSVYRIKQTFGRLKYTGEQFRNLRCLLNQSLINNVRSSSVLRFIGKWESSGGKKVKEKLKNDRYKIMYTYMAGGHTLASSSNMSNSDNNVSCNDPLKPNNEFIYRFAMISTRKVT